MSQQLDKRVEYAIDQLWVNPWNGDGKKAKDMLEEAANEGNGDAYFFLGRCYLGECYVNPRFGFEENIDLGMEYFNKSIELGSAIGMFGAQRLGGFEPRGGSYVHSPYTSLKEIWDEVNNLAENGQVFCQYMIGNAYYYGDCLEMLGYDDDQVALPLIQSFQKKAIEMFEKCVDKGFAMAAVNLIDILTSGEYGMPIDQKRADEVKKRGAELHNPFCECQLARTLEDTNIEQALELYQRSITHGGDDAYYYLGELYLWGTKLPKDLLKAKHYYEKGLEANSHVIGCKNGLGKMYFDGVDGIEQDYNKAFGFFKETRPENKWCSDMLGTCYLKGLGTSVNYEAAKEEFLVYPDEELSAIGLGEIYCYGLGVKQNIRTGMEYLNKFPNHPRVKEIKSHFKRGLFGWKQIN